MRSPQVERNGLFWSLCQVITFHASALETLSYCLLKEATG